MQDGGFVFKLTQTTSYLPNLVKTNKILLHLLAVISISISIRISISVNVPSCLKVNFYY